MTSLNTAEIASMRTELQTVQLSMTCTIQRNVPGVIDPDGHPVPAWIILHEDLPCWYWEQILRSLLEETTGPFVNVSEAVPEMLLPANTDVQTSDKILIVHDMEGQVKAENLNIKTVLHRLLDVHIIVEQQQ